MIEGIRRRSELVVGVIVDPLFGRQAQLQTPHRLLDQVPVLEQLLQRLVRVVGAPPRRQAPPYAPAALTTPTFTLSPGWHTVGRRSGLGLTTT